MDKLNDPNLSDWKMLLELAHESESLMACVRENLAEKALAVTRSTDFGRERETTSCFPRSLY